MKEILEYKIITLDNFAISIYNIIAVIIIFGFAKLILFIAKISLNKLNKEEVLGQNQNTKAIYRIIKYFVYTVTILTLLKSTGLDISFILASSTALFVGLGFGLQDAFKDMASGILMYFEKNVKPGDIIEVEDGTIGTVLEIDLRTSKIRTRDGIMIIIPNSKFVNDNVINWSVGDILTRFDVKIGVAYGSDTQKVKQILLGVLTKYPSISAIPEPYVRFADFGDSSLDFSLSFWTEELWTIEKLKSDIRFDIDAAFKQHNISIPFPQRDLHIITDRRQK